MKGCESLYKIKEMSTNFYQNVSKHEMAQEIDQLNQQLNLINQKISERIDSLILDHYQQLENDVTYTYYSLKKATQ